LINLNIKASFSQFLFIKQEAGLQFVKPPLVKNTNCLL